MSKKVLFCILGIGSLLGFLAVLVREDSMVWDKAYTELCRKDSKF